MVSYFNIRKEEHTATLYGFLYSFVIVAFFILTKSLRDSLFLNNFSKQELSYLYLVTPIITGVLVWIFLTILKGSSLFKRSLIVHFLVFALSTFLLLDLSQSTILLYYIFVEFQIAVIALLFWEVLSECFTNRQAKRLFVIMTSGGFLSALLIGSSLPLITKFISQEQCVIIFNILILICPLFTYQLIQQSFKKDDLEIKKNNDSTILFKDIFKNKYILNIIFITFLFTIISVIIDYNFKVISYSQFPNDAASLTNYFARFYSLASFISFIIQITISGYIINRHGIKYALMILPVLLLFIFVSGYFISSFIAILLLKGKEQVFKSTLHDTSMHILWMPIPSFKRLTIKPMINILLKNIFSSLAAGLLILSVYLNLEFIHFIPIACVLLLILIFLTRRTKDFYVEELIKAIDDRSLTLDDESSVYISDDNEMLSIVRSKLIEEKKNRYFILHLLDSSIIEKCKDTLGEIFFDSDVNTQKIILKYLVKDDKIITSDYLIKQVNNKTEIALKSLDVLCIRNIKNIENINENLFNSDSIDLKCSAINNCIKFDYKARDKALSIIKEELRSKENIISIIDNISSTSYNMSKDEIIYSFSNLDHETFISGLKFITKDNCDSEVLDLILNKLHNTYYHHEIVLKTFQEISNSSLHQFLEYKFLDKDISLSKKKFINDIIVFINDVTYISIYEKYLELTEYDDVLLEKIFDSLISFKRKNRQYFTEHNISKKIIDKIIYSQYHDIKLMHLLENSSDNKMLIKEFYTNKLKDNARLLMKMIYFYNNQLFKRDLQLSIFEKNIYRLKVIEIFEEYLSEQSKQKVIPLLDNISLTEQESIATNNYNDLSNLNLNVLYSDDIIKQDDWYMFIILAEIINNDKHTINPNTIINNRYFKLLFNALNFNKEDIFNKTSNQTLYEIMITNLEKTLYLKDSNIFEDIPAKELIYIANCLKEVNLSGDNMIFKDGDVGDSMYFIVKGGVKILKGNTELITLKKGDYFGEMALLDGESRSADAKTVDDSILLKLDANDFEKIMYSNDKIVKGILGMLSQRLRRSNELLNQKK